MTLTRDTYGWVPLPSANPHPEAWLGVGGLIGPSWRAPTALRGLRGALGRWGTSEGRTGLKNAFFGVRFGAATGQEPPDAPKGLRIKSSSGKGHTFRALRGRCGARGLRARTGPDPMYPGFAAPLGTRECVRPFWSGVGGGRPALYPQHPSGLIRPSTRVLHSSGGTTSFCRILGLKMT